MVLGEIAVSQAGRAETFFWKGIEALEKGFSFLLSGSMSQKHPAPKFRAHSAGPCTPSSCHTHHGVGVLPSQQFLKPLPPTRVAGL